MSESVAIQSPPVSPQATSTLRRDIISAYFVTISRVLAWLVVMAVVYRKEGKSAFAVLALVQTTIGVLEYTALGLVPAVIHLSAAAVRRARAGAGGQLTEAELREPVITVYANGFAMAILSGTAAAILLAGFLTVFHRILTDGPHPTWAQDSMKLLLQGFDLILYVGIATIFRMLSDAPAAALQTSHRIFVDNIFLTLTEIIWAIGTVIDLMVFHLPWQAATGIAIIVGTGVLLVGRAIASHRYGSGLFNHWWKRVDGKTLRHLLTFGIMVVGAQMADYLYAPMNTLLTWAFLGSKFVADYNIAVQIDQGMLLLVSAIATTMLPRTALAHASGNSATVRQYYVRGTLATFGLMLVAAPIVLLAAPLGLHLLLGAKSDVQGTIVILPLILIHTVLGGSSAVGRSILFAIGRVRPYTASVLIAGLSNVALGFIFIYYFHWGLPGIVLATIIAVAGRCVFWLPWFTLRAIRQHESESAEVGPFEVIYPVPGPPSYT